MAKGSGTTMLLTILLGTVSWIAAFGAPPFVAEKTWSDLVAKLRKESHPQEDTFDSDIDAEFAGVKTGLQLEETEPKSEPSLRKTKTDFWSDESDTEPSNRKSTKKSGKSRPSLRLDEEEKPLKSKNESPVKVNGRGKSPAENAPRFGAEKRSPDWQQTIKQVVDAGGSEYRLEPGSQPDSVVFLCHLPDADPRVVHRFEAEAPDPAAAAHDVLEQLQAWRAKSGKNTEKKKSEKKNDDDSIMNWKR